MQVVNVFLLTMNYVFECWNDGTLYGFPLLCDTLQDLAVVNTSQLQFTFLLVDNSIYLNQEAFHPSRITFFLAQVRLRWDCVQSKGVCHDGAYVCIAGVCDLVVVSLNL
jgi:hypothetical protein